MKKLNFILILVLIFSLSSLKIYCQNAVLNLQQVTENLYLITSADKTNLPYLGSVAFLISESGIIVVESGCSPEVGKQIAAKIKDVSDKPIRYLILTHGHWDHVLGAQSFPTDVITIAHENTKRNIPILNDEWVNGEYSTEFDERIELIVPDITFNHNMELQIDDQKVELKYLGPSHTNGDIMVYFINEKVIHIGDMHAFTVNAPFCELNKDVTGSIVNWLNVYNKIGETQANKIILGHDKIVNKEKFENEVDKQVNYLNDLKKKVQECINEGITLENMKEKIKLSQYNDLIFHENNLKNNIEVAYQELLSKKNNNF